MDYLQAIQILNERGIIKTLHRRDGSATATQASMGSALVVDSPFNDINDADEHDRIGFLGMLISVAAREKLNPAAVMAIGLAEAIQQKETAKEQEPSTKG